MGKKWHGYRPKLKRGGAHHVTDDKYIQWTGAQSSRNDQQSVCKAYYEIKLDNKNIDGRFVIVYRPLN
jgi:hypothetical protein